MTREGKNRKRQRESPVFGSGTTHVTQPGPLCASHTVFDQSYIHTMAFTRVSVCKLPLLRSHGPMTCTMFAYGTASCTWRSPCSTRSCTKASLLFSCSPRWRAHADARSEDDGDVSFFVAFSVFRVTTVLSVILLINQSDVYCTCSICSLYVKDCGNDQIMWSCYKDVLP